MPLTCFHRLGLGILASFAVGTALAARESVALPGERAYPESITSTRDGTLYTGSIATGGIIRVRPNAEPEVFIQPGAFGSASTFGVLADERSNTLWVCSNDLTAMGLKIDGAAAGSALLGFDLKTGEGKVSAAFSAEKSICNDIAIGPDGAAYVTNTSTPQILRLPRGGTVLEVWFTDPSLQPEGGVPGLDGIAFAGNGSVYVNRYVPADLYRIEVKRGKAGKLTKMQTSRDLVLADAMRPVGRNTFLMIEGGGRVDRVKIKGDRAIIETIKDGFVTPTGVTRSGKDLWVSEGQLSYLFDPALKDQKPTLPFHLYSVPMPK